MDFKLNYYRLEPVDLRKIKRLDLSSKNTDSNKTSETKNNTKPNGEQELKAEQDAMSNYNQANINKKGYSRLEIQLTEIKQRRQALISESEELQHIYDLITKNVNPEYMHWDN